MNTNIKPITRVFLTFSFIVLFGFILTGSALAAEFRGGDTVIIPANETIEDDLFVSANRIEVNGVIEGDLFVVGADVTVNGTVEGSLFISGQSLSANGRVDGSLYSGGYALTLDQDADIGRNVYFGGFSLNAEPGSIVGRSLYAGGYQTVLSGEVKNDVNIGGVAFELNGVVGGDVLGEVGTSDEVPPTFFMPSFPGSVPVEPPGLRVSGEAEVGGILDIEEVEISTTDLDRPTRGSQILLNLGRAIGQRAGEFIALVLIGGILLYVWPNSMQNTSNEAQEQPLPSAGWGCLVTLVFIIGVPIVIGLILLLAVVGGAITFGQLFDDILGLGAASLGLIITTFTFVVAVITKAIVAFLGGKLILDRLSPRTESDTLRNFAALALGALIYEVLRAIPFLGWIFGVIVTLIGLGAIYFAIRKTYFGAPIEAQPLAEAGT